MSYGDAFIDRQLRNDEHGHYRCGSCGKTFTADGLAMHRGYCKGR
jgi:hypothetical protein